MSEQPGAVEYRTTAFGAKPRAGRQHQTTLPRALMGAGAGAVFGGLLLAGGGTLAFGLRNPRGMPEWLMFLSIGLSVALGIAVEAGLLAPLWRRLHRQGHTRWPAALLIGAVAGALNGAGISGFFTITRHPPHSLGGVIGAFFAAAVIALMVALPGAAVAALVWHIAYRKAPSVAEAF